jgi:hypothetical protein
MRTLIGMALAVFFFGKLFFLRNGLSAWPRLFQQ